MNWGKYRDEKLAEGYPIHVIGDMFKADQVPEADRCGRCGGTGNQLLSMFQECEGCGGDGRSRGNEETLEARDDERFETLRRNNERAIV